MNPDLYTLEKVQIIQNLLLWTLFKEASQDKESLELWHGTSTNNPDCVYQSDGFNIVYAKATGYWGKGLYFAVNAQYSCPKYCYKLGG